MTLEGKCILVTRSEGDAESLASLLESEGAEAIAAPTIEFLPPEDPEPLDDALRRAVGGEFSWIVFATPRAVAAVAGRMDALHLTRPLPARAAGVGPTTVQAMREAGFVPALMPDEDFSSHGLVAAFPEGEGKVLLPRADIAPAELEEGLTDKGWTCVRVTAYLTRHPKELPGEARAALDEGRINAVVLTSPSTVRGYVRMAGRRASPLYVCIGPVTAKAAREAGLKVDAVADPHTIEGLVAALKRALA
jgi:uroporphyrinogen-III synthase